MNSYKKEYIEKKEEVLECLEKAKDFLTSNGYEHQAETVDSQMQNLKNGEFSISVVGEFSAGKSTFLNALMGEKILPSFTNETTATINFLRHKSKSESGESGRVYYNDGHTENIQSADIVTITNYVSTSSKEVDVAQSVSHLDLFLESKFLEDNVTLVDTPGLNGTRKGHREITEDQIEKSSAGIFLFKADQPGSESDFRFLTELRKRVKNIIFVLNKIDGIKASEGETVDSVIEKLKQNYKLMYPEETTIPEIWPLSAYEALVARSSQNLDFRGRDNFSKEEKAEFEKASRMGAFEDRLWRFLTCGEKTKQALLSPVSQLISQLSEINKNLNNELSVISGSVDKGEIEEQMIELEKMLSELDEKLNEQTKEMKNSVRNAESEFNEEVKSEIERFKNRFTSDIENFTDIDEVEPEKIEKNIEKSLMKILNTAYENYTESLRDTMYRCNIEITDKFNETLSANLGVTLDNKLEVTVMETGIEKYSEETERLKAEIDKISQDIIAADERHEDAFELERKRLRLEQQLADNREKKEWIMRETLSNVPEDRIIEVEDVEYVSRGGIFGTIADILIGKKLEKKINRVVDSTARKEYERRKDDIISEHNSEENRIRQEMERLESSGTESARAIEKQLARLNELRERKREALRAYEEEASKEMAEKYQLALKRQKNEINSYIDSVTDQFISDVKRSFRKERDIQLSVMKDSVGVNITGQINLKKRELEALKIKSDAAVAEKDRRKTEIEAQTASLKEILIAALDIESDINDIRVDVIAEEKL